MPSITIIGPGAIGGTVAAWLAQDPINQVSICARTPFSQLRVDTPNRTLIATPPLFFSPNKNQLVPQDWVLIATKAYDVDTAVQWLPELISDYTRVAILQNGVEHIERFSPYVDRQILVPVVVDLPAERRAPGHIRQKGTGNLISPDTENGRDFAELFTHTALTATTTTDFKTQAWKKLALNATGALSALLLKSIDLELHPEIEGLVRQIVSECIQVGRAEGATLPDELEDQILEGYRHPSTPSINSLHSDRLAGRPMEIDARNGAVVRFGQRHGIDTPMNQLMVTLLKATQDK
jgi:2-dehydropantoate 2-reductase